MADPNGENKPESSGDFGKVIDALHSKQKLSSLRTYQGDMAEFIKEKNESVISIAVKEKQKKEKEEEEEKKAAQIGEIKIAAKPKPKPGRFKANIAMFLLSLVLLAGGAMGVLYAIELLTRERPPEVVLEESIIPFNRSLSIVAATRSDFEAELAKAQLETGITLVKVSGQDGLPISQARGFFEFLKVTPPFTLSRILKDDYVIAALRQGEKSHRFLVLKVGDFGGAFAGMLDWEDTVEKDLSFLSGQALDMTGFLSTSTAAAKKDTFVWKDVIVKNKDVRALVNQRGQSKVAYTFLDKNTLLVIGDMGAIGEISSAYASRSVAR